MSDLVVQLALGMALRLGLAGKGEVGKIVLGALGIRSKKLRFLGVQEGEGLRTRPVSLHAHRDSFNFRFTQHLWCLSREEPNCHVARLPAAGFEDGAQNRNWKANKNGTDQNHKSFSRSRAAVTNLHAPRDVHTGGQRLSRGRSLTLITFPETKRRQPQPSTLMASIAQNLSSQTVMKH